MNSLLVSSLLHVRATFQVPFHFYTSYNMANYFFLNKYLHDKRKLFKNYFFQSSWILITKSATFSFYTLLNLRDLTFKRLSFTPLYQLAKFTSYAIVVYTLVQRSKGMKEYNTLHFTYFCVNFTILASEKKSTDQILNCYIRWLLLSVYIKSVWRVQNSNATHSK